jgi:hypothetical protein
MSSSSYIDKALRQVQDGERRAYTRLRTHLGLSSLPNKQSASVSAPSAAIPIDAAPPIPACNPARGHHYTGSHSDAASRSSPPDDSAKQEQKEAHNSKTAEKSSSAGRNEETPISYAEREKDIDTEKESNVTMDDLSDAIGQALDEWKDASNHS